VQSEPPELDESGIVIPLAIASLKKFCKAVRNGMKINRESQRLSRNLGVHTQVLNLFKFMNGLTNSNLDTATSLAHTFLQDFCEGDPINQKLLHHELDFFIVTWPSFIFSFLFFFFVISFSFFR